MEENAKYFVVDSETGRKVNQKALPLEEAKAFMEKKLTESSGSQKLILKQYLVE